MILSARRLSKQFRYRKRGTKQSGGWRGETVTIDAVQDLNLEIAPGERVAFIGPNGAGKSTPIKMFSGILTPSSGEVTVCGFNPVLQRKQLAYRIGCVFGQRSQLLPNLPLTDSLELFGRMYDMGKAEIAKRSAELVEIFAMQDFAVQPVRQLSLGQRMRGEIAASLMHKPQVVFLDEPTIGLDVVGKRELRQTLRNLNDAEGTTLFLTSHDTGDIEALSERLVIIDHGKIILDAPTAQLQSRYLSKKQVKIDYAGAFDTEVVTRMGFTVQDGSVTGVIDTKEQNLNAVLGVLLQVAPVADIHLYDEALEDVIIDIYEDGVQP